MSESAPVLIDARTPETTSGVVQGFVRNVRHHWYLLLIAVVVGALAGWGVSALQPKVYAADATGIVTSGNNSSLGMASATDTLAKSKATQYQSLASSRKVAEDALEETGYKISPQEALGMVTAAVPLETAQIQVTVRSPDPESAQRLADAWINALSKNVKKVEGGNSSASASSDDAASEHISGASSSSEGSTSSREPALKFVAYVEAQRPTSPVSPNVPLEMALGALAALALMTAFLFIRAVRDRSIRSVEILAEVTDNAALLGTIPLSPAFAETRLISPDAGTAQHRRSDFSLVESFKELRTNLQFMNPDHPPRRFVVTSCLPSDGKSTVADNLAITLAQGGEQVYLVDADLRRPTVAKSFGVIPEVGLTDVIIGKAATEEVIQHVEDYPNLNILGAGRIPPNPSEILASERFTALIEELAQKGTVIMDAPPLLPVSDSAIIATKFDGALVVVEAGGTTRDQLAKALGNLNRVNAKLLGTVLNKVPAKGREAGYYYYYGKDEYYAESTGDGSKVRRANRRKKRKAKAGA